MIVLRVISSGKRRWWHKEPTRHQVGIKVDTAPELQVIIYSDNIHARLSGVVDDMRRAGVDVKTDHLTESLAEIKLSDMCTAAPNNDDEITADKLTELGFTAKHRGGYLYYTKGGVSVCLDREGDWRQYRGRHDFRLYISNMGELQTAIDRAEENPDKYSFEHPEPLPGPPIEVRALLDHGFVDKSNAGLSVFVRGTVVLIKQGHGWSMEDTGVHKIVHTMDEVVDYVDAEDDAQEYNITAAAALDLGFQPGWKGRKHGYIDDKSFLYWDDDEDWVLVYGDDMGTVSGIKSVKELKSHLPGPTKPYRHVSYDPDRHNG